MRNNAYWANRMRILEEALLDKSYGYVQNLEAQYEKAIREIEAQIKVWYQRFASANGISFAEARKLLTSKELEEFKWTVFDYIKNGQNNAITGAWAKQLENASARVHISRLDALKLQLQHQAEVLHGAQSETLTKALNDLYANGYYRTAFEIQKGLGVGWSLHGLTDAQIKKVLARPWTTDAQTFSDRIWANKEALVNNLNTQLTQMIMRGTAPDKAIKSIANQFNVSKSKAGRLIMTESAAFANLARKDCFDSLGVEKFVIVETLDKETCPLCGQLDGKVFPMSEYQVGVTAPPFHPWCRGTTAPYYDDMDDLITRAAKDDDGKTYEVPENIDYETWKKKYVENAEKLFTNKKNSDIINSGSENGNKMATLSYEDTEKAHKALRADSEKWQTQISEQEENGLRSYTISPEINAEYRSGKLSSIGLRQGPQIDSAISKFNLSENTSTIRGTSLGDLQKLGINSGVDLLGQRFSDKGYLSTSLSKQTATNFALLKKNPVLLHLDIPAGVGRGAYIEPLSVYSDEYEFLLKRGAEFEIYNYQIEVIDGKTVVVIKARWVP